MNFAALTPGYDFPSVQKTLDDLKNGPHVATFGTNLIDSLTNPNLPLPLLPWKEPYVCGDFTLLVNQVDTVQPIQVQMGNYAFFPIVNVKQEEWNSNVDYYQWLMGYVNVTDDGDVNQIGSWKLVWGGDVVKKPEYVINETPLPEQLNRKLTLTINLLPGYTVSVYYHQGILYFVLFPMDYPGLNVDANYGNNDTIYKWIQEELDVRQFTVPL